MFCQSRITATWIQHRLIIQLLFVSCFSHSLLFFCILSISLRPHLLSSTHPYVPLLSSMCVRMTQSSALPPSLARSVPNHITSLIKFFSLWSAVRRLTTIVSKACFHPPPLSLAHQWLTQHQWMASHNQTHVGLIIVVCKSRRWKDIVRVGRLSDIRTGMANTPQAVKAYSQSCWASLGSSLTICAQMLAFWNCTLKPNHAHTHAFAPQSFLEFLLQAALLSFSNASVWVVFS